MIDSSLLRYMIIGVANTMIGLSVIYLCKWLLVMGDIPANVFGYAVGLIFSFFFNRKWSFEHKGAVLPAGIRFIIVIMVAYIANLLVVLISIDMLNINSYLAHAIGVVPYFVIGYLGSRFFVFRNKGLEGENTA